MSSSAAKEGSAAKAILVGLAAILLLIVAIQNAAVVSLKFLFWTIHISKILIILLAALFGFVIGLIGQSLATRKSGR